MIERDKEYYNQKISDLYSVIENKEKIIRELQEELQKADSITQSCIFEGKEESTMNFRECLKALENYKQRIEKAIAYINDMCLCSSGYFDYGDDLSPKHIVDILKGEK